MVELLLKALIPTIVGFLAAIGGLVGWFIKRQKRITEQRDKEIEKYKNVAEWGNFAAGFLKPISTGSVKTEPSVQKEAEEIMEWYNELSRKNK